MPFSPKAWVNEPDPLGVLQGTTSPSSTTPLNAAGLIDLEVRLSNYADSLVGGAGGFPVTGSELQLSRDSAGIAKLARTDASGATYLRILPGAVGSEAGLQLYEGSTGMWEVGNDTANKLRIRDLVSGGNVLEIPSDSFYSVYRRRLDMTGETASPTVGGGCAIFLQGDLDPSKTGPFCKLFAIVEDFAPGSMSNGSRGDQLGNDNTISAGLPTVMSVITGAVDGENASTVFDQRGAMDVLEGSVVSAEVVPTTAITASPNGITNSGGLIKVTSTAHGCVTNDVVTIAGATPSGVNGPWEVTLVDANNFTLQGSTFVSTGGGGTVQLHIYGDVGATHVGAVAERPGGGVQGGEWSAISNAGKWAKTHGLGISVIENNTYASWTNANAAGDNPIWHPTSYYRNRGSAGLNLINSGTGQAGTMIQMTNFSTATPPKRWMNINRDSNFNVTGADIFVIEAGDATGVRVGIGAAAAVNQTINPTGLGTIPSSGGGGRLVIAPTSTPTAATDGIQFGTTADYVNFYRSGNNSGKMDKALWVVGNVTAGAALFMTGTGNTSYLHMAELSSDPSAASANTARLFVKDIGGSTAYCVRFPTGAVMTLAKEGGSNPDYTTNTFSTDRNLSNSATILTSEVADVLATLISDLQANGTLT